MRKEPFSFVQTINLKTAKTIELDAPWFLMQGADQVSRVVMLFAAVYDSATR
jgi:hypothetical protein